MFYTFFKSTRSQSNNFLCSHPFVNSFSSFHSINHPSHSIPSSFSPCKIIMIHLSISPPHSSPSFTWMYQEQRNLTPAQKYDQLDSLQTVYDLLMRSYSLLIITLSLLRYLCWCPFSVESLASTGKTMSEHGRLNLQGKHKALRVIRRCQLCRYPGSLMDPLRSAGAGRRISLQKREKSGPRLPPLIWGNNL